jgi:glucose-1-phosphate adenylyltransferase
MGSDFSTAATAVDTLEEAEEDGALPAIGVGQGTHLRRAIVDKNARIGRRCRITNAAGVQEGGSEAQGWVIRAGLVVLLKDCVIPDGTVI